MDAKPKGKSEEIHPTVKKRYVVFAAIVVLLAGVIAYFAFAANAPVKTSSDALGKGPPTEVKTVVENPAVNTVATATSFEAYKTEYMRLRGMMGPVDIRNPYALFPIENIGKGERPLAYALSTSTTATTWVITNIEIGSDQIKITVEDGKNPNGVKPSKELGNAVLSVNLFTEDYYVGNFKALPSWRYDSQKEVVNGKATYEISERAMNNKAGNSGLKLKELLPKTQYIAIALTG